MKIIRVFPRKTSQTPDDSLVFIGNPPFFAEADQVMVSVTFSWDIPEAERLAEAWKIIGPVQIGGPAYNQPGGEFIPGMFLKHGNTITSRGCNNRCWFCSVWKRENGVRELEIKAGWNIQDDNLLACTEQHIRNVFIMLKQQKNKAQFTGGIEAALLQSWHVDLFVDLKPSQIFFAYDTSDDFEPLVRAARMMTAAGFNRHHLRCYVLIGYPKDTITNAEKRFYEVLKLGMFPQAMLWKDHTGDFSCRMEKLLQTLVPPCNHISYV